MLSTCGKIHVIVIPDTWEPMFDSLCLGSMMNTGKFYWPCYQAVICICWQKLWKMSLNSNSRTGNCWQQHWQWHYFKFNDRLEQTLFKHQYRLEDFRHSMYICLRIHRTTALSHFSLSHASSFTHSRLSLQLSHICAPSVLLSHQKITGSSSSCRSGTGRKTPSSETSSTKKNKSPLLLKKA